MTSPTKSVCDSNRTGSCSQKEQDESTDVFERLQTFTEYFVKEFETKLYLYHMVLEEELKKPGKYSDKLGGKTGKAAGGGVGYLSGGTRFLSLGLSLGEEILRPILSSLGADHHKGKVVSLAHLVYASRKDKASVRTILVEASYDIFQSFEMQFMGVYTDAGYQPAMQKLARDATNRAINYLRNRKPSNEPWNQIRISEAIILGKSKIEPTFTYPTPNPLPKHPPKTAGFEIKYAKNTFKASWHTSSVFEKVGLIIENETRNDYFEKDGSRTEKYGYRRLLKSENWEGVKTEYKKPKDPTKSEHFTNYQYILSFDALGEQCKNILMKIDEDDKDLAESRIREMLGEVKEDLLEAINSFKEEISVSSSSVENIPLISNLPRFSEKRIVNRPTVIDEIDEILKQDKCLVICGISGTGKSTIAIEYGRNIWNDDTSSKIVRFVSADSFAKINGEYKLIAEVLQISFTNRTEDEIMQLVHSKIENSGSCILFIFDNVEKYGDVQPYVDSIQSNNINNIKVIMTTKDTNVRDDLNLKSIKLDPFTRDEAKSYMEANAPKNKFDMEKIECLLEFICNDEFVLPYSLKCAVAHFKQAPWKSVTDYISDFEESHECTGTFMIFNSLNKSGIAWRLLQYSAYLDPDFIGLDILRQLLSLSIEEEEQILRNVIIELKKLSFMKFKTLKNGDSGLKVSHRLVQDLVKKYADINKNMDNIIDKVIICEQIVRVLETLFPSITEVPNEDWQVYQLLSLHAMKLLQNIQCDEELLCKLKRSMSSFYQKLGDYNMYLACNVTQALVYYEQALNVLMDLFPKDNSFDNILSKTDDIANFIEYIETGRSELTDNEKSILKELVNLLDSFGDIYVKLVDGYNASEYYKFAFKMQNALYRRQYSADLTEKKYKTFYCETDEEEYVVLNHLEVARSFNKFGSKLAFLGYQNEALTFLKFALEIQQEHHRDADHPDVATSLAAIGSAYRDLDNIPKSLEYSERALNMQKEYSKGQTTLEIANSYFELSRTYDQLGDGDRALKYGVNALEIRKKLLPENNPDIIRVNHELSFTYAKFRYRAEAKKHAEDFINGIFGLNTITKTNTKAKKYLEVDVKEKQALIHGQYHPMIAGSINDYAVVIGSCGEINKALEYLHIALQMQQEFYRQENHKDTGATLSNLSLAYEKLGDWKKSIKYLEDSINMFEAVQFNSRAAQIRFFLGYAHARFGRIAEALKHCNGALKLQLALHYDPNDHDVANTYRSLAYAHEKQGDGAKALKYYQEALKILEIIYPEKKYSKIARFYNSLGFAHAKFGDVAKALEYCDNALKMQLTIYSDPNQPDIAIDHLDIADTYRCLGFANEKQGDGLEALQYYQKALNMIQTQPEQHYPKTTVFYNSLGFAHAKGYSRLRMVKCPCSRIFFLTT